MIILRVQYVLQRDEHRENRTERVKLRYLQLVITIPKLVRFSVFRVYRKPLVYYTAIKIISRGYFNFIFA